ncbi:MAG: hypothetical protein A2612_02400 [Candidatus Moranbacteria bacterium RIFOXYD1_FULL_44_12]|nr:MAG: hypothetical protein A2612_02400 [Candidatus Moranbacteria bacterium RIFOXYD1_FULL_44_12]
MSKIASFFIYLFQGAYFLFPFPSCISRRRRYNPHTPTIIPTNNHWVAASHIGSIAQERAAINTAVTEIMKKISDDDFIPICSPPLVFTLVKYSAERNNIAKQNYLTG